MKIFAGPFIGEFGWELFGWQGYLRSWSTNSQDEIYIAARPGHEVLYADFATKFIPYEVKGTQTCFAKCDDWIDDRIEEKYMEVGDNHVPSTINWKNIKPTYIRFGTDRARDRYDMIVHARFTDKHGTGCRDWPIDKWKELISMLNPGRVASIGSKNASLHVPSTTDLRGVPLSTVVNILASSKILLGPSSGPMHLGSLCGIPHVVWSDNKKWAMKNKDRYEIVWNPLKTPVIFIEKEDWQPDVTTVRNTVVRMMQEGA